ncbi:sulfatase [Lacipirellula parvula]|uniref:Sulfatase n=2 Tax=Lacipirellula parvula TaxID=2650471 RepID=A0A5K7XCR7_9BACT|nr:sulfatase [Lacipirellula parvula]
MSQQQVTVASLEMNCLAPSPLRGGLGRGANAGTRCTHPSLTLPLKGREPEVFARGVSAAFLSLFVAACCVLGFATNAHAADRPNILWLSTEDMSPHLGCYGDKEARTPNIDKLAAEGIRFDNAFVPSPVCATCRSSIITGVYSAALGTHHMRSKVKLPQKIRPFPTYLREAGYYCTNNEKQDYNFKTPAGSWDESSFDASWKNRQTDSTPFFAVFNFVGTHESSIRGDEPKYSQVTSKLAAADRHDPAKLTLPPYYPDTPKVREHWARYYNVVSSLDLWVAEHLAAIKEAGLADDTIVFFWSDHGAGIPRHKRWLYDTGMRVPLIVYVPEKWRHLVPCTPGEVRDQLVSLVDLGPTVLNLAGVKIPAYMQGQPFLGPNLPAPREYVYGVRDRMDESYDMIRAVRDGRYKYIRNYRPDRPYSQHQGYGDNSDIMREWRRLAAAGELNETQALFMREHKPVEELYDTDVDPYELNNLAADPAQAERLAKLSAVLDAWMLDVRDLGVVPEGMLSRIVPEGANRYKFFRDADGAERYQRMVNSIRETGLPLDLVKEANGADGADGPVDDSIRILAAERTLNQESLSDADRDAALATLIEIYRAGGSPWDQAEAATVLDLHVAGTSAVPALAAANREVKEQLRSMNDQNQPANSLKPWANRFDKRFVLRSEPAVSEK